MTDTKITLPESEIPTHFYNIVADLPTPLPPPLHPGTREPIGPDALAPIFPAGLIAQEVSQERMDRNPGRGARHLPSLPAEPDVPRARIRGGARHAGAHLLQVRARQPGRQPQAEHRDHAGVGQQTGRGEAAGDRDRRRASGAARSRAPASSWASSAWSTWCAISYDQKPYRRIMMKTYGAEVVASPSPLTARRVEPSSREDPDSPGSLGIAISEAVEDAAKRDDTKYSLGSVLNHVLLHQTIIGQEAKKQMELAGDYPDILIALPRRRQQLRRARLPLPAGQDRRLAQGRCARSPSSPPPAQASRPARASTTSATRRAPRR